MPIEATCDMSQDSLVQWNGCTWVTRIQRRQTTNFTAPGCSPDFGTIPQRHEIHYHKTPQISTPPKISTPSVFPEICCQLQCPESTYPPNISTPVSWKYVHNRWNMHNSVFSTEITRLNRLFPCWIFHPTLSYPPKVSTAPENKYLHRR